MVSQILVSQNSSDLQPDPQEVDEYVVLTEVCDVTIEYVVNTCEEEAVVVTNLELPNNNTTQILSINKI